MTFVRNASALKKKFECIGLNPIYGPMCHLKVSDQKNFDPRKPYVILMGRSSQMLTFDDKMD